MWDKLVHDYGTVAKAQKLKASFTYTGPLKITRTTASCGCTVATVKEVNDSQVVEVTYNTGSRAKSSNKAVNIFFNDESYQMLRITALIQ